MLIVCKAMPPMSGESVISRGINFGGFFPSILLSKSNFLYFFSCTSLRVWREGVAEPRNIGISSSCARLIARSLPENLNPSDCLYDWSCSSSTIIKPRFLKGIKTEDLVPITIFISPNFDLNQTLNLWLGVSLEW